MTRCTRLANPSSKGRHICFTTYRPKNNYKSWDLNCAFEFEYLVMIKDLLCLLNCTKLLQEISYQVWEWFDNFDIPRLTMKAAVGYVYCM